MRRYIHSLTQLLRLQGLLPVKKSIVVQSPYRYWPQVETKHGPSTTPISNHGQVIFYQTDQYDLSIVDAKKYEVAYQSCFGERTIVNLLKCESIDLNALDYIRTVYTMERFFWLQTALSERLELNHRSDQHSILTLSELPGLSFTHWAALDTTTFINLNDYLVNLAGGRSYLSHLLRDEWSNLQQCNGHLQSCYFHSPHDGRFSQGFIAPILGLKLQSPYQQDELDVQLRWDVKAQRFLIASVRDTEGNLLPFDAMGCFQAPALLDKSIRLSERNIATWRILAHKYQLKALKQRLQISQFEPARVTINAPSTRRQAFESERLCVS